MKVFPTDAQTVFLVAEDVRLEQGGKFSALGVYAGGDVLLPKDTKLPTFLASLVIIIILLDGEGQFQLTTELLDPSGKSLFPVQAEPAEKRAGAAMTNFIKLSPFKVEQLGRFEVRWRLDNTAYSRTFAINLAT